MTVTILPPVNVDQTTFPVYSGFIHVQGVHTGEILHTSYQGLAAAAKDLKVIDNTDAFYGAGWTLPVLLDARGYPQIGPQYYTFVAGNFPTLLFRHVCFFSSTSMNNNVQSQISQWFT